MASQSFEKPDEREEDDWNGENSNSPEMMTTEIDPALLTSTRESSELRSELSSDMAEWSPDEVAAYTALRSKRKKCCVGGCTHRSLPIARSYHQLPVRNKEVWAKWIEVVRWSRNEPDWTPNGDAAPLVCSRHFPDSDFISYEASSRVRLSHTAIPVYFVDPPEGTVMDVRFSNPLPIPPMLPGPRQKDTPKSKNSNVVKQELNNERETDGVKMTPMAEYGDNLSYDIEEVTEENYEGEITDDHFDNNGSPNQFPYLSINAFSSVVGASFASNNRSMHNFPHSSSSASHPRSRNLKYASSSSKPPALIRANFIPFKDNVASQSPPLKLFHHSGKNVNGNKLKLPSPVASTMMKLKTPPTKHKIGLAKCRLIVQTLENQLKIAKMRLAEQLEIPYQVVHGVWNMRDSLKDKL